MRLGISTGLALSCVLISSGASADGPRFGGAGQLAITDDQPLGAVSATSFLTPEPRTSASTVSFEFASVSDGGGSGTAFAVAPAADYFVIGNLSLGANVLFAVISPAHPSGSSSATETLFGIIPRVGFNVPFNDTVSWWPKLYFGYTSQSVSSSSSVTNGGTTTVSSSSGSANAMAIGVFAPFMFQPSPHFILGIGPNVSTQLSNNQTIANQSQSQPKVTEVGIQATVGGWCLGN